MLGFYHGLIIVAALGAVSLLSVKTARLTTVLRFFFVFVGSCHLGLQAFLLNYHYQEDPSNPYVYAHTSSDILSLVARVAKITEIHEDGEEMFIEVICPDHDYWPLPWYLRFYPNVGWWSEVDFSLPPAPLILAFPIVEQDVLKKLYELPQPGQKHLYLPLFENYIELRPQVEIRGYVLKELWDSYIQEFEGEQELKTKHELH